MFNTFFQYYNNNFIILKYLIDHLILMIEKISFFFIYALGLQEIVKIKYIPKSKYFTAPNL